MRSSARACLLVGTGRRPCHQLDSDPRSVRWLPLFFAGWCRARNASSGGALGNVDQNGDVSGCALFGWWSARSGLGYARATVFSVGPCLPFSRVLALVGGLGLIAAFFMPWFASQGLLLSGQFLNDFLGSASAADLQRFLPGSSPNEARLLRALVDLFPVCGGLATVFCLLLTLSLPRPGYTVLKLGLILSGVVPLVAWAGGISRLPPGSGAQIGLWLIAFGSLAVLLGAAAEFAAARARATEG
jgi:hypothetical protein